MDLQYVFVVVATVLVGIHTCRPDDNTSKGAKAKNIYCGRHLSQTLSAVCKGNYNTLNKKSDIYEAGSTWSSHRSEPQQTVDYPFQSKARASSSHMTGFRQRKRRGVFNECCEKPCSHEELSSYCGGSSKKR